MSKQLIINKGHTESRAALLENGEILDLLFERSRNEDRATPKVGNIYRGKVLRVLPGMQSAFVDIGYEKAAFLYVDDAYLPTLSEQREMAKKLKEDKEAGSHSQRGGEIIPDEFSTLSESVDMKYRPDVSIESFLKEGDHIIVQVAKEPISTKGPRVTRHITLAGRHVVYMPFIEHTGVSRRIENEEERDRLKEVLDGIRPEGKGIIARTVAEGQSYKVLKSDYNMLVKIWKEVSKGTKSAKAPALLYEDLNFFQRVLRDVTDEDVSEVIVDNKDVLKEVEKFSTKYLPSLKGKGVLHDEENPLFEHYGIELEIERALSNQVYLKSGGSINVDQTEALVSIDVNTGKFVGRKTLEETILKTNLEAVKEIAYQLRIRNCGGIIIIDFIDMEKPENREMVYKALLEALKKDKSKTNVLTMSEFGLVEMTRKRTRDTLTRLLCEPCPYCEGTGRVKSKETVCSDIIRDLVRVLSKTQSAKVFVYAHPGVTDQLSTQDLDIIESLEEQFGKSLQIRSENSYHIEQYEVIT